MVGMVPFAFHLQLAILYFSKSFHIYYLVLPFEQVVKPEQYNDFYYYFQMRDV